MSESTRSRRSEQEADALIDMFAEAVVADDASRSDQSDQFFRDARAALRTALLEPSTDAGEDARRDSERLDWLSNKDRINQADERCRLAFVLHSNWLEGVNTLRDAIDAARAAAPGVSPSTDAGEDARRDSAVRIGDTMFYDGFYGNVECVIEAIAPIKYQVRFPNGVVAWLDESEVQAAARAAAPGVSPEVSNG